MSALESNSTNKVSIGTIILVVILALIGAGLVLLFGIWLGGHLGGRTAEGPPVNPPTPAPDTPYIVANYNVNVRSGPGTNYPVYGVAQPSQSAEVNGKSPDNAWWAIKIPTTVATDGQGWISAAYVSAYNTENVPVIQPPPPPPDIEVPPPGAGGGTCTTREPLNVRSGPGNEYPSYGKVPKGVTGQVIGVSQDFRWWAVQIPTDVAQDGRGWVNTAYCIGENTDNVPIFHPSLSVTGAKLARS